MWRPASTCSPGCSTPPAGSARPSGSTAERSKSMRQELRPIGSPRNVAGDRLTDLALLLQTANRRGKAELLHHSPRSGDPRSERTRSAQRRDPPKQSCRLACVHTPPRRKRSRLLPPLAGDSWKRRSGQIIHRDGRRHACTKPCNALTLKPCAPGATGGSERQQTESPDDGPQRRLRRWLERSALRSRGGHDGVQS